MEQLIWTESPSNCRTFITQFEDEVIHVIKTGFNDKYMVVWEDAHEVMLGTVNIMTKKEVEERFNISLEKPDSNDFPPDEYITEGQADHPLNSDCPGCGSNGYNCKC